MEITRIQSFLFALCFLFFWGCTAVETRPPAVNSDAYSAISFTRVELKGEDNSVSMKDLDAYLHFKTLAFDKKAVSVEPLADGEDTLLYVINYEEGWEMEQLFIKLYDEEGNGTQVFNSWFERNPDGTLDERLRLKDPDSPEFDGSETSRKTLRMFLEKIAKLRRPNLTNADVEQMKASGEYYEIPLTEAV